MGISRSGISRSGISRDGVSVSSLSPVSYPGGSLAFYDFSKNTPSEAIIEQVGRASSLSTVRASDSNVIQLDGSLSNYGSNIAAMVLGNGDLIQPASTNFILESSDFDNATWTELGVVNVDGAITSNGYTFAEITNDTSLSRHAFQTTAAIASSSNSTIYQIIKRGTSQYVYMFSFISAGVHKTTVFDLDAVTVSASNSAGALTNESESITELAPDLFLIKQSFTPPSSASIIPGIGISDVAVPTFNAFGLLDYTGLGTETMYIAHSQMEKSIYSSSPIITTGASAARVDDDSSIVTTNWVDESRIGFYGLSLETSVSNQVLWESGDSKLSWDGADLVATINATTATIAVADPTTLTSAYWEYDSDGDLYAIANGVRGTGTASAAPVFGANANLLSDEAVANHAQGVAGKFIVQDQSRAIIS